MTSTSWHTRSAEDAARALETDLSNGLTRADADARLERHGPNELARGRQRSALTILVHQFRSLIVALLAAAGGVALLLGDVVEAIAILVVIVINALIGFVTEWKARSALEALRKQAVAVARVRRDGDEFEVPAEQLVPGDVVLLSAGDRVPADGRLVENARIQVDESALTGESLPVAKSVEPVGKADAPVGDRVSMVHMGTGVTDGRGVFIVTATGGATQMGHIGTLIAGVEEHGTPLEDKLAQLSRALLVVVLGLCVVIVVTGWLRGNELLFMTEVGISLAIAAVPEGLLAVTTMTLAVGMQRMARMNALVRRLPAVESLGSTTVICSDKTGTLTRNEMTVRALVVEGRHIDVGGTGYAPEGDFAHDGQRVDLGEPELLALRIGALCNDARVDRSGPEPRILGDPTEGALIVAAEKAGLEPDRLAEEFERTGEIPFNSVDKRMVTVHRTPDGRTVAYMKGSPAAVLRASAVSEADRQHVLETNTALAGAALRVLAVAHRDLPDGQGQSEEDLTRDFTFAGLIGMIDPLRDEARDTITTCREAGIRAIMITGDQQATAAEIARQLGLDVDPNGRELRTVHARKLTDLDDDGWLKAVDDAAVFARVSPEHKLRIVDALQRQGHVVAMTGDGVNDAPALRQADIGIAMGIRGTEVSKEAAAMVITDDNFATIVRAVEQGRIIVHNILRFIHYLFSCNFAEIMTVFTAIMLGWPLPLGVLQILWLNLITDIFPAMALALEPSAPGMMKRPPRDPDEPLMTPAFGWLITWQGLVLAACTLGAFAVAMRWYGTDADALAHAVTIAFMTLAMAQVLHAFNARSRTESAFSSRLFTNGWLWGAVATCIGLQLAAVYVGGLRDVLGTVALGAADWGLVAVASALPVGVVEAIKAVQRQRDKGRTPR